MPLLPSILWLVLNVLFLQAATVGSSGPKQNEAASTLLTQIVSAWPLSADGNDAHVNNDLTNVGSVLFVAAGGTPPANMPATVADFASTGQRFTLAGLEPGTNGNGMAWSVWFRTSNDSPGTSLVAGANTSGSPPWRVQIVTATNRSTAVVRAISALTASPTAVINDSAWHLFVMTYTTSDKQLRAYLDGAAATVSILAGTVNAINNSGAGIHIGGAATGDFMGENLVAEISENVLWDRDLTDTEVACLWNGGAGGFYPFTDLCLP